MERPCWTMLTKKAFPCSVALVLHFCGALPCSVALVLQFLTFLLVPHVGSSEGVRNVIKSMFFFFILKMNGALGAATKWIPKKKNSKIHKKNECFARVPWELLGVHLGWSLFRCARLGSSNLSFGAAE